jgi:hypothetical protein
MKFSFLVVQVFRSHISKVALTLLNLWYCNMMCRIPKLSVTYMVTSCTSEQNLEERNNSRNSFRQNYWCTRKNVQSRLKMYQSRHIKLYLEVPTNINK